MYSRCADPLVISFKIVDLPDMSGPAAAPQTVGEIIFTASHGARGSRTIATALDLGGGWIEPLFGEFVNHPEQQERRSSTQPSRMQQLQRSLQMYSKDRRDDGAILTPLLMSRSQQHRRARVSTPPPKSRFHEMPRAFP